MNFPRMTVQQGVRHNCNNKWMNEKEFLKQFLNVDSTSLALAACSAKETTSGLKESETRGRVEPFAGDRKRRAEVLLLIGNQQQFGVTIGGAECEVDRGAPVQRRHEFANIGNGCKPGLGFDDLCVHAGDLAGEAADVGSGGGDASVPGSKLRRG